MRRFDPDYGLTEADLLARDSLDGGKFERSGVDPYHTRVSPGYLTVPIGKGCILVLTTAEYARGLKRGKSWRRRQARQQRTRGGRHAG